ncbi:MAG: hypothetical protein HQL39_18120 [Alphaproteobacteria bacterium]|nr:hypothetical protein [Alphaproteobacteria bacterium]
MRVLFHYPTPHVWGPATAEGGLPGTEEAILYLSTELATAGLDVSVVTGCGPMAGRHGGVLWIDQAGFAGAEPDVAVITEPGAAALFGERARIRLWLHIDHPPAAVMAVLDRLSKIMPLSQFSRSLYPAVPDDKVFVTRNGIVPEQFEQDVERQPFTLCYGSDYDRGLLIILELWPQIREVVPEARLRVFYGWQVYDSKVEALRAGGAPELADWLQLKDRLLTLMAQDGVTHLGRIGHREVAAEFLRAEVWAYPCQFPETSCITAMKAQAGGAIPVVVPVAALAETVVFGVRTTRLPADIRRIDRALLGEYGNLLVSVLRDRGHQEEWRPRMTEFARRHFAWRSVAREWLDDFRRDG